VLLGCKLFHCMRQHLLHALDHPLTSTTLSWVRWAVKYPFDPFARQLALDPYRLEYFAESLGLSTGSNEALSIVAPYPDYRSTPAYEVPHSRNPPDKSWATSRCMALVIRQVNKATQLFSVRRPIVTKNGQK